MREPIKPNKKGPRFKVPRLNTSGLDWVLEISKDPDCQVKDINKIKAVIVETNKAIADTVVDFRDGIELPDQLGYMFLGTCQPKVRKNVDFKTTEEYKKVIQHRNWESDNYLAKIFYTNFETKYKFKFHQLWGFKAAREFTKTVGREYPQNWKKYIQVDHTLKISRLYRDYITAIDREHIDKHRSDEYDPLVLE
jgi:hypothetical protein